MRPRPNPDLAPGARGEGFWRMFGWPAEPFAVNALALISGRLRFTPARQPCSGFAASEWLTGLPDRSSERLIKQRFRPAFVSLRRGSLRSALRSERRFDRLAES